MTAHAGPESRTALWLGRALTILAMVFFLLDASIHLVVSATPVVDAFARLGVPFSLAVPLGLIGLVCLAAYLLPSTSMLGALPLTGYLGGARVTQMRIGAPLFSTTLFPVYFGICVWGALYLRSPRIRTLVPLRTAGATEHSASTNR